MMVSLLEEDAMRRGIDQKTSQERGEGLTFNHMIGSVYHDRYSRRVLIHSVIDDRYRRSPSRTRIDCVDR
jgi:hypothetical protein